MSTIKRFVTGAAVAGALALSSFGSGVAFAQEDPNMILMQNSMFSKPDITVPAGTTLTWMNVDGEAHDVIERFSLAFESPLINPGETWAMTFDTPGTYAYVCDLHANMEGVVNVV
jgi:plastocyanin